MYSAHSARLCLLPIFLSHVVLASLPLVDFDRMGKVGLAGAFAGLDFFHNSSLTFDSETATLLSRSEDGRLTALGSTNSGGRISSGCALDDTFYLAGSFSSIGSIELDNVASYSPSSGAFSSLGSNGPNGQVEAVFCDQKNGQVWFGGEFTSPGTSVAVWNPDSSSWSEPPFKGLSGAGSRVLSITANSSESSLFFAGSFITSFQGNGSLTNGTNNPNVPFSAGATPFSSSLVPIPLQGADIVASPSSNDPQFSSIENALCPAGDDGPGNTWFAADGNQAVVTVRAYASLSASGIRLGNTFSDNHGTTGFSVTTLPDNTVRSLKYLDPTTQENVTCTDSCPLSTDSSLLYQDFLFGDDILSITGIQITLSEWTGDAPGLHLLQLLSSGAFASSLDDGNGESCYAPSASSTSRTGDWQVKVAKTDISGTTQSVLVSNISVGESSFNGPTISWSPYVSASGEYMVNMLVPGCVNLQDCELRTSVKVVVFAGVGQPWVTDVSQQNEEDSSVLVYSGPIVPSSPDFVTTITMALSDNPAGSGQGGQYELVAGRIELLLISADISSTEANGGSGDGNASSSNNGFGIFEWPLDSEVGSDATSTLLNSSETYLDGAAFDLYTAMGGRSLISSVDSSVAAVVHHSSGTIFLAGNLTLSSGSASGAKNLVMYESGSLKGVNGGGLNGPVSAMVLVGDQLYVGGSFDDTSATATGRLSNVAVYDVQSQEWSPMGGGVNGEVRSLGYTNGQVQIAGTFTELLDSSGEASATASGFAVWDTTSNSWVNTGGFLVGDMTFIGNGTSSNQFVAGNVRASQAFGATGMVLLENSDSDMPSVTALNVQLEGDVSGTSRANTNTPRRAYHRRASSWVPKKLAHLWTRQSSSTPTPLPPPLPAPAPAVLAGAFWTNNTSSNEVAVIGGNFSVTVGGEESIAIAIYDQESDSLSGLKGSQINGVVRTLLVDGDVLYIGGQFTLSGDSNQNGFAIYNLATQEWDISGLQFLSADSGSNVTVHSITKSASRVGSIFVAGSFAQAGSLRCRAICSLDTSSKQWTDLGNGIQGEISSVAYAGDNQAVLVAGGSIVLDGAAANIASFTIANSSWASIGSGDDIPGPVTALEVNEANVNSIFAAGKTTEADSFLTFWNGQNWTFQDIAFESSTIVSQLAMVPLQNTHSADGVIQSDRMLMISGVLDYSSFGNASSALYDGQTYIPYITSSSSSGTTGAVAALFHSFSSFPFAQRHFLATGVVILISIAISAGVVFLLALIGIIWTLFSRRDNDKMRAFEDDTNDDDSTHRRPSSLLEHINAATRATVFGGAYDHYDPDKDEKAPHSSDGNEGSDPFGPDASNYLRAETPSDAMGGGMLGEETSRPARARYSFDGVGEGELRLSAGAEVEVLDDRDAAWWYARDIRSGSEGVVPAAYLY